MTCKKEVVLAITIILSLSALATMDTTRTSAQPPPKGPQVACPAPGITCGENHFLRTQRVTASSGDAIVAVANNGRAVLGIGRNVGGQFETGDDGLIFLGRGAGHDRITINHVGDVHTKGGLQVDQDAALGRNVHTHGGLQVDQNVTIGTDTPVFGNQLTVQGNAWFHGEVMLGYVDIPSQAIIVPEGEEKGTHAQCPSRSKAMGGGFDIGGPGRKSARVITSTTGQNTWIVWVRNDGGNGELTLSANVICAKIH